MARGLNFSFIHHQLRWKLVDLTMLNSVVFAVILAQLTVGQVVTPPANTPQCLITCSSQFCPTAELSCICGTEISNITTCALSSCSTADQQAAAQIAESICGKYHFR